MKQKSAFSTRVFGICLLTLYGCLANRLKTEISLNYVLVQNLLQLQELNLVADLVADLVVKNHVYHLNLKFNSYLLQLQVQAEAHQYFKFNFDLHFISNSIVALPSYFVFLVYMHQLLSQSQLVLFFSIPICLPVFILFYLTCHYRDH